MSTPPIAFIGGGNMAQAIIAGASTAGALGDEYIVCDPDESKHDCFARATTTADEAIDWLRGVETEPGQGQVFLAVKPQMLGTVAAGLRRVLADEPESSRIVVSILAGATSETIRSSVGAWARVIRVMPNTPARVNRGMSAVSIGAGAEAGDEARALGLLNGVGRVVSIDESLMDAYTGLAGSGPAYVFYLAEGMLSAALEMGFDPESADIIVRETIAGSGALLASSSEAPSALRAAVTSKGGTTAAATSLLDEHGALDSVKQAVIAARDRGAELARSIGQAD